ncbi:hypothetical protein L249_8074 [Ophiocordyceps polyrhachis-furcata BCC 54312]|uniref:GED domain-containing protein n=1 Tax=Ophiocordyceps polyrhachis-furcata BCC 54312 TaxID=1330021 RepID=A0A367LI64_9HYPO|nr:hypothetical protein L249_8074 [Ophiocordyceps polyrhachis-furcata BCC 54312]
MAPAGLGSHTILAKIDKLRELNLVVVGDQSSGKSSVLESLTGFSFPRAAGLCTRYATQITCCRDPIKSVHVSIIPRPEANDELKARLLAFHRRSTELDNDELVKIFNEVCYQTCRRLCFSSLTHAYMEQANQTMGIRMTTDSKGSGCGGAFSQDILKIEVNGPEEVHLTVIDVPGIFRVPTPGLTTETDITLVENMVKSYMNNSRTIILAVMPCNVDSATQEVLKLAEVADPDGTRTMGVLTKPDLATEKATRDAVMELILGKRSKLKLGYYVVKNRSADDGTSTLAERSASETAFFLSPPWTNASERCGIVALKGRLRHLLTSVSKQEFPHVKAEVEQRLYSRKADLETMGPARADHGSQRMFLGKIASRFQAAKQAAVTGLYSSDSIFKTDPDFKLITKIILMNEAFSDTFWKRSHVYSFGPAVDDEGETAFGDVSDKEEAADVDDADGSDDSCSDDSDSSSSNCSEPPAVKYPELQSIIQEEDYRCPEPVDESILNHIQKIFASSRGPELGTFGGTVLSAIFELQSQKWVPLALSHTSKAILLVHDFIFRLLQKLCPEKQVKDQLWHNLLLEKLGDRYRTAMQHARFLLEVERSGYPTTFNHYFNSTLQQKRGRRISMPLKKKVILSEKSKTEWISASEIDKCVTQMSNKDQVCEDILDTLASYYKVSRKRFVDVICQQVISHFLLNGRDSPLNLFCPDLIMGLDDDQLEAIAGEDDVSKQQRQALEREVKSLEAALQVLRV